jgi:hypothetical protein
VQDYSRALNFRADFSTKKVDITASLGVLQVLLHMFQRDLHLNSYKSAQYLRAGQFFWKKAEQNGNP